MKNSSLAVLRVGVAITFLWIGILIIRDPDAWGGLLKPWAAKLLPVPLEQAMYGTAVLDLLIGLCLLIEIFVLPAAIISLAHLIIVLSTVGIDVITVRDIGLAGASLALIFAYWPPKKSSV